MPGCESNNENFWTAMDDQTSVVQALHPDWSLRDIKVEVARFLRPKFKLDIASKRAEESGAQGCDLEIELTPDGDIRYVQYGRTLSELNERTRTLTPEQYHPEDAITNSAIRSAFAQGATRVVTSYWRPGEDHRDFVVMEIDQKTGKGRSKTVNIEAITGKTYGMQEMSQQAEKLFSGLKIHFSEDQVFIATDISLDRQRINTKVQAEKIQAVLVPDKTEEAFRDVIERSEELGPEFSAKMTLQDILIEKTNEHILFLLSAEPSDADVPIESSQDLSIAWKKQAEELLHITPEQSEKLLVETQETWTMMTDAKEVVSFVHDMGVGMGAAFYAIEMMTISEIHQEQSAETSLETWQGTQQEAFTIAFVADTELLPGAGVFVLNELAMGQQVEDVIFTEPIELTEEQKIPNSVDAMVLTEAIEFIRAIDVLPVEDQQNAIKQEKENVEEKIILLWETIATEKPAIATIHTPTELVDLKPKENHVEQFSFAFALWMLFKLLNYHSTLESLETFVKQENNKELHLLARIQKEKPEGFIQKESGQWMLLAIIWHLAMIREQAMQTNQTPPAQKKKKQREVIIFTYAS